MGRTLFRAIAFVFILHLVSCGTPNLLEKYNAEIVLDSEFVKGNAKEVYIRLPKPLNEREMLELSSQLRSENMQFETFLIIYLLPEAHIDSVDHWAVYTYHPEFLMEINTQSKFGEEDLRKISPLEGEIIGKWITPETRWGESIIIYKVNSQYRLKNMKHDGTIQVVDIKPTQDNPKNRFEYLFGGMDYVEIGNDGRLRTYYSTRLLSTYDILE